MDKFFFAESYLLKGATLGDIDSVQAISDIREFEGGASIVTPSDENRDIMIVAEGGAKVETTGGDLIENLRVGAMFGEIAFLDGKNRTANVFAIGKTKVMVIPEKAMKDLMKQNPKLEVTIYRNAAQALCQRLRDANSQIEGLLVPR